MSETVKHLADGRAVVFDEGTFDRWCVYVVEAGGERHAPRDETYFNDLRRIAGGYVDGKVYSDFVAVYEQTTRHIDPAVLSLIDNLAATYEAGDRVLVEQWFAVLYAGMIAEENKRRAKLKKRIKRLGMHQVLVEGMPPSQAAHFSRDKKWYELAGIMHGHGF